MKLFSRRNLGETWVGWIVNWVKRELGKTLLGQTLFHLKLGETFWVKCYWVKRDWANCYHTVFRPQMGAVPPWTSEIYWFHGGFRPQMGAVPPWKEKKINSPLTDSWILPWYVNHFIHLILKLRFYVYSDIHFLHFKNGLYIYSLTNIWLFYIFLVKYDNVCCYV